MRKFGRKLTSALLASVLPIGAAPAQAAQTVTLEGAGTAEDPYLIKNEVDLAQFAMIVGGNSGYVLNPNACAELTANIDLRVSWQPIGTCDAHKEEPITFTGTFDGNGHTISGNIDNMGDNYQESTDVGLFACLGSGGTVKNLKFTGSVRGVGRATNIGGIVGENIGIVTNCTFSGSVKGNDNVGGIVGQNDIGGSVTDCTFSSGDLSVSLSGNIGGVVGQNNSSVTGCTNNVGFSISGSGNNIGGVVGNNSCTVENCSNSGGFSVPPPTLPSPVSGGNIGGVVGQNSGADARITSCYNTGDLCNNLPSGSFDGNLGGVVGSNSGNSSITNCYSTGTIGNSNVSFVWGTVGGVVGSNTDNSNVTNCYSAGGFGKINIATVGGVIGNNGATVTNCYFLQQDPKISGIGSGETTGATAVSDLTDPKKFQGWDFANIWRISQSLNRPVLQENAQDGLPPGLGTEASPYRISTTDELKSFRDIVNGEDGTVQITLAHDGEFGFTMTLSAPLGEENAGYWANLYHYDEEAEKLNFEAAAEIDEDGNVKIPFTHASQYAIVIDDHSHATVPVSEIFIDIAPDAWYKDAVQYAYDNGLMTGVSDTEFAPEATTTRAMIVSILARLEGVTSAEAAGFADVSDEWYATAVNWAANVGVVNGYEDNTFRPNTAITREQLAAMLMNYSAWKGEDVSARADLSTYSDAATISSWANDVMQWAVAEGLISGMTEDTLQPQGNATRAQVAAILQRFLAQ